MKKTIFWLLGVFTLLSMILVDRAEAFTILNVNPTFSGSTGALSGERCSLQGSTSVGCSVGNPGDLSGFASFGASGSFSQNGIQFSSSALFFNGSAFASTNAQLGAFGDPIVISLSCQTSDQGSASLFDVTTSLFLFGCSSGPFPPLTDSNSGTVLLNLGHTYAISTSAGSFDPGFATISFQGDFSVVTPEPSTFCLLGMALIALGLVSRRFEKGKERQAIHHTIYERCLESD